MQPAPVTAAAKWPVNNAMLNGAVWQGAGR